MNDQAPLRAIPKETTVVKYESQEAKDRGDAPFEQVTHSYELRADGNYDVTRTVTRPGQPPVEETFVQSKEEVESCL